jgi:hypothetical protein
MFFLGVSCFVSLLPLLLHQWKEASEEFTADHRSLENEMGVGICFFFPFSSLLCSAIATLAFIRPNENDSGSVEDWYRTDERAYAV